MEKGIVKKVEEGKPWVHHQSGQKNMGYYTEIEQDGELIKGTFNVKEGYNPKYIVGQEATYTKEHNHQTNMWKFTWQSPDGKNYNTSGAVAKTAYTENKKGNPEAHKFPSFALSYAKDAMSNFSGSYGSVPGDADLKGYIEDIKYTASEFLKWLKENG